MFVGLSGGVDSAVSAALLQEQGYDVTGVFIKIWQPEFIECTWATERLDAMRVTAALRIPFREVDFSQEYKEEVVDRMVSEYARGITPNPDVLCNRHIKFGAFADWAQLEGADCIATGHYARVRKSDVGLDLLRARDANKDQSYFLFRLGQKDLAHTLFPIGELLKEHVRREAKRRGLPVADKPDSQGLCFVGQVSMPDFLARFIKLAPGPVIVGKEIVGEHRGAALYTIGQRHGFTVRGAAGPHYVTRVDVETNTLYVSSDRNDASCTSALLSDVHWINNAPVLPCTLMMQARYREEAVAVRVTDATGGLKVEFSKPHIAAPGQSAVFYQPAQEEVDSVCLGGGTISAIYR